MSNEIGEIQELKMNINLMTKKQFMEVRERESGESLEFTSMVILPMSTRHDSGYRNMDFVAVNQKNEPICRLSGFSDAIHIDGIGGYGKDWLSKYNRCPDMVPPTSWSIDCLPKSGLLRIFSGSREMTCGDMACSSFEIFSIKSENKEV